MAAYRRVDDLRSPAGWLPVHQDQLRAQRSVSSMGSLYLYLFYSRQHRLWRHAGVGEFGEYCSTADEKGKEQNLL